MELAEKRGQKKIIPVIKLEGSSRPKGIDLKVAKSGKKWPKINKKCVKVPTLLREPFKIFKASEASKLRLSGAAPHRAF